MNRDIADPDLEDEISHLEAKLDEARSKLKEKKRQQKDNEATLSGHSHSQSSTHQPKGTLPKPSLQYN